MTKHYNKEELKQTRRNLRKEMTYAEKIMWIHLKSKRTLGCKFRRQYSIDNYVIDFYSPEIKLAVELDGNVHELPEQKEYNIKRQKYIEKFGVTFIRITNDEFLGNPNKAFGRIENEILRLKNLTPPSVS